MYVEFKNKKHKTLVMNQQKQSLILTCTTLNGKVIQQYILK